MFYITVEKTNLMILTSSLMLTLSGTRNLVLSRSGRLFSPWNLSMITCEYQTSQLQDEKHEMPIQIIQINYFKNVLSE